MFMIYSNDKSEQKPVEKMKKEEMLDEIAELHLNFLRNLLRLNKFKESVSFIRSLQREVNPEILSLEDVRSYLEDCRELDG
jgi:hypothetical protein